MAEFVQKRLEDLLPELEQLERVQLFSKEEVRAVIKRRKEFEYRLQRKQKAVEDYTRYIDYERNLLKLIWKRRERLGYTHKKDEIDHKIVTRIQQHYRIACIRFSDNVQLFLSHIEFCKEMKQFAAGSRVFTRLLRTHSQKPDLWVAAATYELEDNNSPDTARQLMLRALRLHPECVNLWTASFRLELKYVKQLRERQNLLGVEEMKQKQEADGESDAESAQSDSEEPDAKRQKRECQPDPVLRCGIARVVALQAMERLPEVNPKADPCRLITSLLAVCREFDFTQSLEQELRDTLVERFPDRALTYDTLARAELAGGSAPSKLRTRLQLSSEMYEQGLLSDAPSEEVFSLYLSSLVEVARSAVRHRHLVLPRLSDVLERAHKESSVSALSYLDVGQLYLEIGVTDRAAEVTKAATDAHPSSADLWKLRIQALAACGESDAVCSAFEAASVAVPDSAPGAGSLWLHVLLWAAQHRPDYTSHVFTCAAARGASVLRPLKPAYLRWLASERSLVAAREMFDQHHTRPPVDLDLFLAMLEIESNQDPVDVDRLRTVYRAAARHCGAEDARMWLDYVKFEREQGDPAQAANVYRQAVKSLTPEQADTFVTQHTLMVANMTDGED